MQAQEEAGIISWRECSKLVLRLLEGKSVQQGRYYLLGPVGPHGLVHPEG